MKNYTVTFVWALRERVYTNMTEFEVISLLAANFKNDIPEIRIVLQPVTIERPVIFA